MQTYHEVKNAILRVKSTAIGLDGIFLKFIKLIYLLSLDPNTWKTSKVIHIAKIKSPTSPSDYRPTSILPSLSKAHELLIKDQIMDFVMRNCLLNRLQSGFRPAHSPTIALLNVTDDFRKSCERHLITVLLLLDFSKAFDSVIQDLLCSKLSLNFRFHSTAVALIKSYLE
jgi:Reverse transcriptase (RNA-dependent DNA polymerase)